MSERKDGGPAYPAPNFAVPDNLRDEHILQLQQMRGMSLRDYFAAKAMQGELASQNEESGIYTDYAALSKTAYEIADAMLKQREAT